MYKLLIVDDEKGIRTGLKMGVDWGELGCEVIGLAEDGVTALEIVAREEPDIVITDVKMDRMNGLELCKRLEERHSSIQCILITAFQEFDIAMEALNRTNIVKIVVKPTTVLRISEAVAEAISKIEEKNSQNMIEEQMSRRELENNRLRQSLELSRMLNAPWMLTSDMKQYVKNAGEDLPEFYLLTIRMKAADPKAEVDSMEIVRYAENIFRDCDKIPIFGEDGRSYKLLLYADGLSAQKILSMSRELVNVIECCTEYSAFIGLSSLCSTIQELRTANAESESAAQFAEFHAGISALEYENVPPHSTNWDRVAQNCLESILNAVNSLDVETAILNFRELYNNILLLNIQIRHFRNLCFLIMNCCIEQTFRYEKFSREVLEEQGGYNRELLQCHSMDGMRQVMEKAMRNLLSKFAEGNLTNQELVRQVEEYIRNNYSKELSLNSLAAVFYISPSYLSSLFKKEMNVGVSTYIQTIRMEQAQSLARKTNMFGYEIGKAVGIHDPVYFSKSFKKATGLSLRDYRLKYHADEENDKMS